ncbi:hypothetical protein EVAR_31243_1 [Eumeta japonica]|uniref:Uncharacterized protein n=1 Tax=Eumeta variegata TaxID=151549 RepID=A0A4C1VZ80_EUMVA|nr:hypothetical protein EVAR_31243_1 [Eumeta japonica]
MITSSLDDPDFICNLFRRNAKIMKYMSKIWKVGQILGITCLTFEDEPKVNPFLLLYIVLSALIASGHTFDCNPDPTSVFNLSSVIRFGPGPACDSVPIRFYTRPVRNSLLHAAFEPDFATSHNANLDEAVKIK